MSDALIEDRRARALAFIAGIPQGGFRGGLMADDFVAWTGISGVVERAEYLRRVAVIGEIFPEGLHFTFDRTTAEGDSVALQVRGEGVLFNGKPYAQNYMFVVEFDAEARVRHCREYIDTQIVHEVLRPAMVEWTASRAT